MASSSSRTATVDNNLRSHHDNVLDPVEHLPLYKAALRGDWQSASQIFEQNPNAASTNIMVGIFEQNSNAAPANTLGSTYALHVAIGTRKSNKFVEKLITKMSNHEVETLTNGSGETAISVAASVGNTEGVKLLVDKVPDIPNKQDIDGRFPIHKAAHFGHRETYLYLHQKTTRADVYEGASGVLLLCQLILAGFYDFEANLVLSNSKLATLKCNTHESPLYCLAKMPSAFYSGSRLTQMDNIFYSRVRVTLRSENVANNFGRGDPENPTNNSQAIRLSLSQHFNRGFTCTALVYSENFINRCRGISVSAYKLLSSKNGYNCGSCWKNPGILDVTRIREMKLMHFQALRLLKLLCIHAADLDPSRAANIFRNPVLVAARHGVSEVVENIIKSFPIAVQFLDNDERNIFQLAVLSRRHKIFSLIYRISDEHRLMVVKNLDRFINNILHLVGNLPPLDQRNSVPGAALQMQRELQWFKEVETIVPKTYRDATNTESNTPRMVFTKEHEELVKEGEKWMKDTVNSCSVVAAVVATIVFAAAITVPGGTNSSNGFPVFQRETVFVIFSVFDTLSLFSSTAAILLFLSILTARYTEDDFFESLPKRLIMGILTLFVSIISMMVAFGSTVYFVFGHEKPWVLAVEIVFMYILLPLLGFDQFLLLFDMIPFVYANRSFGNNSEDPLY